MAQDTGKTYALITGASGGIGMELARLFASEGHNLVLVARSADKLEELASTLSTRHRIDVRTFACDLSEEDAAERVYAFTRTEGLVVDNLVNNAGFGDQAAFVDSDWERQRGMVQVNIVALMQLTYLYGQDMRDRGFGHILNLSSVAAFCAGPYMSIYYASKAFVLSFSEAVGEELRGTGVTVTALCPGPTNTGFERAANMEGSKMFTMGHPATAWGVASRGYRAMQRGKPVVYDGAFTKAVNVASRIAPRAVTRAFAGRINGAPAAAEKRAGKDAAGSPAGASA